MDGPVGVTQCDITPGSSFTYNFTVSVMLEKYISSP
jgi:FtsP/CotA-like multicopper oxidase with cupredoxin domain